MPPKKKKGKGAEGKTDDKKAKVAQNTEEEGAVEVEETKTEESNEEMKTPTKNKRKADNQKSDSQKKRKSNAGESVNGEEEDGGEEEEETGECRNVFVGGISFKCNPEQIKEFFQECGPIKSFDVPMGKGDQIKGIAKIAFETHEAALKAVGKNGEELEGRNILVKMDSKQKRDGENKPKGSKPEGCSTIYVGNLTFDCSEEDLRSAFASCGEIKRVSLGRGHNGKSRGFGHIEFGTSDCVDEAIKLAGQDINGRPIRIDYSTPTSHADGGGGGFSKKRNGGGGGRDRDGGGRGGRGGRGRGGRGGRGRGGRGRGGRGGRGGGGGGGEEVSVDE